MRSKNAFLFSHDFYHQRGFLCRLPEWRSMNTEGHMSIQDLRVFYMWLNIGVTACVLSLQSGMGTHRVSSSGLTVPLEVDIQAHHL